MERCIAMKEERVSINILNWLESNGWKIICYDFPQSGTGQKIGMIKKTVITIQILNTHLRIKKIILYRKGFFFPVDFVFSEYKSQANPWNKITDNPYIC